MTATIVAATIATAVTTALAGALTLRRFLAAGGLAAGIVVLPLEETTKAAATAVGAMATKASATAVAAKAAAVTPASLSLRFQTDHEDGHGGQSKSHAQ
jgi:hypothetical protein